MGEPACWLHLVCHTCGSVSDRLGADGRCPTCRDATAADADARSTERSDAASAPTNTDTTDTTERESTDV